MISSCTRIRSEEISRTGNGAGASRGRRGFTIVELLISVGIIILLLSLLIVGLNRAVKAAQSANTATLLSSLKQSLIQFKEDVGYFPPVLDDGRNLFLPPDPEAGSYLDDAQLWHSRTTLADYLVGYGGEQADNADGLGIRHPGRDGVWSATFVSGGTGLFAERNQLGGTGGRGQVFGPYFELKDERLLGSLDASGNVSFPGENGFDPAAPKVICDYWGSPIRYYRAIYMAGALNQRYVTPTGGVAPSLWDVQLLQPSSFDSSEGSRYATQGADFALFSPGPDRQFFQDSFFDPSEVNADNIVEVGP